MRPSFITWPAFHPFQWGTLQTHGQWHHTYHSLHITWRVNRRYSICLDNVLSHRSLFNGYQINYTAGLRIFCCYFFWCQPARLACQPLQPGSSWYTFVDDNAEEAPIYRCNGRATKLRVRPHEKDDLYMEWEPTQMESQLKQQMQPLVVPACGSLESNSKIQGTQKCP